MASRSQGNVMISFGLVTIPTKIYGTVASGNPISFNLLTKTGSRVKQQYVSATDGSVVAREDMLKGYEVSKDKYVSFTKEEIKALEEIGTKSVEVTEFVPFETIDSVYLDKMYYLAPEPAAAKAYALFTKAMTESGKVGIGRWVNRGSDHMVAIRAIGNMLTMQLLHFHSEINEANFDIPAPKTPIKETEVAMALKLIESQAVAAYDPTQYSSEHVAKVEAAIQNKIEGKAIEVATDPVDEPMDLMAALEASLNKAA